MKGRDYQTDSTSSEATPDPQSNRIEWSLVKRREGHYNIFHINCSDKGFHDTLVCPFCQKAPPAAILFQRKLLNENL